MRRLTPVILGLILAPAIPQALSGQDLAIGVRGGLNISSASFEGSFVDNTSTRTGNHVGAAFQAKISGVVELQSGFWLTSKGFKGTGGTGGNVEVKESFFEIPMLFGLRIPGKISPHILTGPVLSIETSCKADADGTNPPIVDANCDDLTVGPRTKGADFGYLIGGGVELDIGRVNLLVDIMYNIGLTDVSEFNLEVSEIKNRSLYLSLGVLWPLGGSRIEDTVGR